MKAPLDRLLVNGAIHTFVREDIVVEALGIRQGRVVFAGSRQEAAQYIAREVIDLQGRTVIPGMTDSHMHFYAHCQSLSAVDLSGCASLEEMLAALKSRAAQTPKGQWIRGTGFDQTKWAQGRLPTRWDLDQASREHPIFIKRACLHLGVANSMALERADVCAEKLPNQGGAVEWGDDGQLNGILREQMTHFLDQAIPDPMENKAFREKIMGEQLAYMASLGITSMHTYAAASWRYLEDPEYYARLEVQGQLPLRVTVCLDDLETWKQFSTSLLGGGEKIRLGSYKLFCDGSLGSRSAALYEPYADDLASNGLLVEDMPSLRDKMILALQSGAPCAVHAIGDRGLDTVITAMEQALAALQMQNWRPDRLCGPPFRVIHAQLATSELIQRMASLPLAVDIQPVFFLTDMHWVGQRLGSERQKNSYLWNTYWQAGLLLAAGSDAPVERFEPMEGIYSAVTRQDRSGWPEGGMQPEERLSVYQALCLYCKHPPYANGTAEDLGTLEPGKLADLAVLDRDIFTIPQKEILQVKVLRTMLSGQDTWRAPGV